MIFHESEMMVSRFLDIYPYRIHKDPQSVLRTSSCVELNAHGAAPRHFLSIFGIYRVATSQLATAAADEKQSQHRHNHYFGFITTISTMFNVGFRSISRQRNAVSNIRVLVWWDLG